jgi:hypothetical protein
MMNEEKKCSRQNYWEFDQRHLARVDQIAKNYFLSARAHCSASDSK